MPGQAMHSASRITERTGTGMGMTETVVRAARREDCADIARLFLISSDGLAAYIWGRMDLPGLTPEEVGARRYAREGVAFSYQNCTVAERAGRVVAMIHSYPMEAPQGPAEEEPDPVLRPYTELEDYGSLYVSGVAVVREQRGRGFGTRMLETAHARARALALPRVSLICFERNEAAMRLYRRLGYRELDRRPVVPHPTLRYSEGDAVLLARPVDGGRGAL